MVLVLWEVWNSYGNLKYCSRFICRYHYIILTCKPVFHLLPPIITFTSITFITFCFIDLSVWLLLIFVSFINIILHWSDNLFSTTNHDIRYNYYIYYIYWLVSMGITTININGLIYLYITLDRHLVNPLNTNNCYINYSYYIYLPIYLGNSLQEKGQRVDQWNLDLFHICKVTMLFL